MTPNDLDKLIGKYLAGTCTPEESAYVEAWYARLGLAPPHVDSAVLRAAEAAARRIERHLDEHAAQPRHESGRQRRFLPTALRAAAVIVVLLAFGLYLPGGFPSLTDASVITDARPAFRSVENTSSGYMRTMLPDGSIVRLSPASRIRFPDHNEGPSRELYLEGEAYFDVARNTSRPFFVYAGQVVTEVLGTSFIVRARGQDPEITVSVRTGKVTVYARKTAHKKTVLVSNEAVTYNRITEVVARTGGARPSGEPTQQELHLSEMHFEETPVPEVLRVLSTTYDIPIDFPEQALNGCVLTSSFYDEGLYDRVDVICTAIGATYEIVEGKIVITSTGCNRKPV